MNTRRSLFTDLPIDLLASIAQFIPLFDNELREILLSFITNIGLSVDDQFYICKRYFNNNSLVLFGLLNSTLPVPIADKYLGIWNICQTNEENKFTGLIKSLCDEEAKHQVDGLQKVIFSFFDEDGVKLDRDEVYNQLYDMMDDGTARYQIPVVMLKKNGEKSLLRSVGNTSVFGLSKEGDPHPTPLQLVLRLCLKMYDDGYTKVDFYVTTFNSRSKFVDAVFNNPVIAFFNGLDSIREAWIDSELDDTIVSEVWGDQLHLLSSPHRSGAVCEILGRCTEMFFSYDTMNLMVSGFIRPTDNPIVQIVDMIQTTMSEDPDREAWTIVISDGCFFYSGLVTDRQLLHHVHSGEIKRNAVIRILDFVTQETTSGEYFFVLRRMQFMYNNNYIVGYPIDVTRFCWEKRLNLLSSRSHVDPDTAMYNALDLLDEVLEEGRILEAFDLADMSPPVSFSSWSHFRGWCGRCDVILSRCQNEDTSNIFAHDASGDTTPRHVQSAQSQRRKSNYLQVISRAPNALAEVLASPPYHMPPLLLDRMKSNGDIQSLARRLTSGVHFESSVVNEMIVLTRMAVMWCETRSFY